MNPDWKMLSDALGDFSQLLDDFTAGVTDMRTTRACKKLTQQWNKVVSLHNEYDAKIEPISPIQVKYPFHGEDFFNVWNDYKGYLLESHNFSMKSRSEQYALNRLKKLSDNNVLRAMEMLEFFMSSNSKSIFRPSSRQLTGDEPPKEDTENKIDYTTRPKKMI